MFRRLGNLVDPFQDDAESTPPAGVWPFVREHLRPFRGVVLASLLFTVIAAALEVWLIFYTGRLVDTLAETSRETFWSDYGTELLLVGALVLFLRPLAWLGREALDDIAFRPNSVTRIRWQSHRHVLGQSVGWFQSELSGRIANRVNQAGVSATGAAFTVVHTLSFVAVYILGSLWLMAAIDVRLAIPLAIWIAIYFGLMAYAVPRFKDASEAHQDAQSALSGTLVDTYANIDAIKLFGGSQEDRRGRAQFETTRTAYLGQQRIEVIANAGMTALGTLLLVAMVGYAIVLWQSGDAPLGLVAASLALSFRISGMAEWLLDAIASLFSYIGATKEALKTVSLPIDIPDAPGATALAISGGAIRLNEVSHHYGKGDGGLDRVTLNIDAGEKVGLVGRSGAGKSTLVNLILRFFEPETGSIEIDGQDIRSVTQESLRRHIAMVSQDAALLHRSVGENIAFGRQDVTQAMIDAATSKAEADSFIPGLRDQEGNRGYEAQVGERGVRLSGGQRQRIALARAILKDAPILVLDEATSALDSEVEAAIQETLYRVMEGKTVIAIAHRLSTIAHMDRIVVLDDGRIVEEGSHLELLALNGIYAGLWARQSGGFIGE